MKATVRAGSRARSGEFISGISYLPVTFVQPPRAIFSTHVVPFTIDGTRKEGRIVVFDGRINTRKNGDCKRNVMDRHS